MYAQITMETNLYFSLQRLFHALPQIKILCAEPAEVSEHVCAFKRILQ